MAVGGRVFVYQQKRTSYSAAIQKKRGNTNGLYGKTKGICPTHCPNQGKCAKGSINGG